MPYNLRKRTRPEPEPVVKKRRVAPKKESKKEPEKELKDEPEKELHEESEAEKELDREPEKKLKREPKKEPKKASKKEPKKGTRKAAKKEVEEEPKEESEQETQAESKQETKEESDEAIEEESKEDVKADKRGEPKREQFVFGSDSCGELGLGKIGFDRAKPSLVEVDKPVMQVACGPMHTISLLEDGSVLSCGCNDEGALGRVTEDEDQESRPTSVSLPSKIIKVTAGDSHSAALSDKNEVFIWGNFRDEHGSVGLTPESNGKPTPQPKQIMPEIKFQDIASGSNHMLLLDVDGSVYSFGVGEQGQLGRLKPEQVEKGVKITDENRELFLKPQIVSLKNVDPQRPFICDAIYAGNFSSFATNTDKKKNRLAGWGLNNCFQLGYKGQKNDLVQYFPKRSTFTCSTSMINVACGQHHTLFLTKTGRVFAAGKHHYGMLGLGKSVNKEVCPAKRIESLDDPIIDISAGISTSFAVSDDGKLYSWGMGGINLGDNCDEDRFVPTVVANLHGKRVTAVSAGAQFTSVLVE